MSSAFEDFAHDAESVEAGHLSVVPNPFTSLKSNDEAEVDNKPEFFESEVEKQKLRILSLREAKRQIAAEESAEVELPEMSNWAARVDEVDEEQRWRIDGLWPAGGRVNLTSAPKAGKTTVVANLVRFLVDDGDVFLGQFFGTPVPHHGPGPSVVVFDFEMTKGELDEYYNPLDIQNSEHFDILCFKNRASAFDFMTPETRKRLVERYRGAHTYILDPIGVVLTALGLDENSNSDVQRLLTAWDEFVYEMGGVESAIVNHAGWNGERPRGASAFEGSGDALWMLTNPKGEDGSPRFFRARGRKSGVKESQVVMDENNNLTLSGASRKQVADEAKARAAVPVVLSVLEDGKALSQSAIETAVRALKLEDGPGRDTIRDAVKLAYKNGQIVDRGTVKGGGTSYGLPDDGLDTLI